MIVLLDNSAFAVSLRVAWYGEVKFDPPLLAKMLKIKTDELRTIVSDYLFWHSVWAKFRISYFTALAG